MSDYRNQADFTAYPKDLAETLKLNVVNAACPGETTASMINPDAPSNGCETSASGGPGYRTVAPLHVSHRGSQLSFAVSYLQQHPDTQLADGGCDLHPSAYGQQVLATAVREAIGS